MADVRKLYWDASRAQLAQNEADLAKLKALAAEGDVQAVEELRLFELFSNRVKGDC